MLALGRRVFPRAATPWAWAIDIAAAACWLVAVGYGVFIASRVYRPDSNIIFIWFNAYTFWLYLPVYPLVAFAGVFRRWFLLGALALVALFHLAWILPDYRPADGIPADARDAPTLRVMTTNVYFGSPGYAGIAAEILAEDPDIVLVQEFGPRVQLEFEQSGVQARYPYRQTGYENQFFGNAIYSKLPLTEPAVLRAGSRPLIRVTVEVGGTPVTLYNLHPTSPGLGDDVASDWNGDWRAIIELLREDPRKKVIAGDFNMNQHHRWYRELEGLGLISSHEERGRGNATTWPKGRKLRPIRIDHVFHSPGIVTLSIHEGEGEGSDHRPVIADLAILPE